MDWASTFELELAYFLLPARRSVSSPIAVDRVESCAGVICQVVLTRNSENGRRLQGDDDGEETASERTYRVNFWVHFSSTETDQAGRIANAFQDHVIDPTSNIHTSLTVLREGMVNIMQVTNEGCSPDGIVTRKDLPQSPRDYRNGMYKTSFASSAPRFLSVPSLLLGVLACLL